MKSFKILFLILLVLGCNAKKSTTERTITSDTLRTVRLDYKSKPIETNYTIDLICDTITGKVKPINVGNTSGNNYANLIIENNQLKAKLRTGESQYKIDTIYRTQFKDVYKDREVVRYKTPLWHWCLHLILLGVIIWRLKKYFSIFTL